MRIAIIDTNVVVAGLLTANRDSPTARIVESMMTGAWQFAVSPALIDEYRRALLYPRIARHHRLAEPEIDQLLATVLINAIYREPAEIQLDLDDPDDRFLFALAAEVKGSVLVTGDRALIREAPDWASVVSPRSWLENQPA